jgi:flagellar hook-associated protein 1 FlgK
MFASRSAQSNLLSNGMGVGVSIDAIKRATDRFLQSASLNAGADSARAGILATTMNSAQQLFGDPSGETSFFSTLDDIYSAFSSAQDDPSSSLLRTQALTRVDDFLSESEPDHLVALQAMGKDADTRISADVDRVNDLLSQIDGLNTDITRAQGGRRRRHRRRERPERPGRRAVQADERPGHAPHHGRRVVRSTEGLNLAGDGAAKVSYQNLGHRHGLSDGPTGQRLGEPHRAEHHQRRDQGSAGRPQRRSGQPVRPAGRVHVTRAAEEINRASNAASAVPAPPF